MMYEACIDCGKTVNQSLDIPQCPKCQKKYDLDFLWELHDNDKFDAMDFLRSKKLRDMFLVENKPRENVDKIYEIY